MTVEQIRGDFVANEDRAAGLESEISNRVLVDDNALQSLGEAALLQPLALAAPQPAFAINNDIDALGFHLPIFSEPNFSVPEMHNGAHAQIVFVDPGVHDLAALLAGIKPGMDVVMLDPHRDALDQIAETLSGQHNVAAVHIVAEGSSGQIDFSSGAFDLGNLTTGAHASDLTTIGNALGKQGDLMIWSCNTGQGQVGQAFIDSLAQHTGAEVAASTGFTGAASLGGNWALEAHTGPIHATAPLTAEGIQHYDGELGVTFSIIYPTFTPPTENPGYASGSAQVGFSYGTPGDNQIDNIFPGYKASPPAYAGSLNSSFASDFTQFEGQVVFVATDALHGRELWITDGTVAGTQLIDDINPGSGDAFPGIDNGPIPMQVVGSELFFAANDGSDGTELWETDGVTGGTQIVKDIHPGSGGSNINSMVNFGGKLFFAANDGVHNQQLWTSDGTNGGTTEITDLLAGAGASYSPSVFGLVTSGSHLFFQFYNGTSGTGAEQLYVSDGTAGGTHVLDSALTGQAANMTDINGTLYFIDSASVNDFQLWKSDGTQAGTVAVTNINSGGDGFTGSDFVATANGKIYFAGDDQTHGLQLWETDGTSAGTKMVVALDAGNALFSNSDITAIGNEIYFAADTPSGGLQLWESDGTAANTQVVDSSVRNPTDLENIGGTLYLVAVGTDNTEDLFKLQGSSLVELVHNFSGGSSSDSTTPGGGIGMFTYIDVLPSVSSLSGSSTSSADFATAHTVTLTLDVSQNVTVAGGTTLSLSDGGTATYAFGSGTTTLTFTYSATDAPQALTVTGIASGSIENSGNQSLPIAGTAVSGDLDAVTDSAANVAANFGNLDSAVSHISSITLNDGGTPNLDLTVSEVLNDQTLIGKIAGSYHLVVKDAASTVQGNFNSLESVASSISAVVFTDGGTPTLDLGQAQVTSDASLLAKVQGPYDLLVSGVTGQAYTSYQNNYNAADKLTQTVDFNTDGSETIYGYVAGLTLTGTANNDTFFLESAASVTASGGAGNDLFFFGSGFSSSDQIDGGTGANTLMLDGGYTGGNALTISTSMMTNIEALLLAKGHSYDITLDAGVVSTGHNLAVLASGLNSSDTLTFNGSALTAGTLTIDAGPGADDLTGGAGTNVFNMGAYLTASDEINGGTGKSTVNLDGDYSGGLTFTATTMVDVKTLNLDAGHSYDLTLNAATVASGQTMTIQGSTLGAGDSMTIDGSAAVGNLIIDGGAGNNYLTGGAGNDVIRAGNGTDYIVGGAGADKLYAGTGADTFGYDAVSDSTSTIRDIIDGFNTSLDKFNLPSGVTVIDTAVTTGNLSNTNFDRALAHDIGAAQLSAHGAVLFTPSTGGLAGDTFLIIDENGVAGYQAGQDLVIQLTHGVSLASLSLSNFEST
jgi:ELWxxDGT repeat protein